MRASSIVKSSEFFKSQPQLPLIEGDEIVQTLPSNGPDQSFAEGICRWRLNRCSNYSHTEVIQRRIQRRRKDRITIVNDKPVGMQIRKNFSELLGRPFCGGMSRNITMQYPPRADVHRYKDVQNPEAQRDGYKEVTSHNRFRFVPNERGPALIGASVWTFSIQVFPDGLTIFALQIISYLRRSPIFG
jgi:hypothetical protein